MTSRNESGRSMVEILGVLAIMGVLSIIAIAGYQRAITAFRTNQTIDRLTRRALAVSSQKSIGQEPSLDDFNPNDGTYIIDSLDSPEYNIFSMVVHHVDDKVCSNLIEYEWKVGYIDKNIRCVDQPDMTFYFSADLASDIEDIAPADTKCSGEMCNGTCCPNDAQCVQGVCKCPDDKPEFFRGKCFVPCPSGQTRDPFGACQCPDGYFNVNGVCTDCSINTIIHDIDRNECARCYPMRSYISFTDSSMCVLTPNCNNNEFVATYNIVASTPTCYNCDDTSYTAGSVPADFLSCESCNNSTVKRFAMSTNCYSCDEENSYRFRGRVLSIEQEKANCLKCPNRFIYTHIKNKEQYCGNCNKETLDSTDPQEACNACPNREIISYTTTKCLLKCTDNMTRAKDESCVSCNNESFDTYDDNLCYNSACNEQRFVSDNSKCISCSTQQPYNSSEASCHHCSNRTWENGKCYVTTCNSDYFHTNDMSCESCSSSDVIESSETECQRCSGRSWENGKCYLTTCDSGDFHTNDMSCESCSYTKASQASKTECQRCSDRSWEDGVCYKTTCNKNQFHDIDFNCVSCIISTSYTATQSECDNCSGKRVWASNGQTTANGTPIGTCKKK